MLRAALRAVGATSGVVVVAALGVVAGSSLAAMAQTGDAANGEELFKRCRSCHEVGPNAKSRAAPALNDLVGRTAGTVAGFRYSEANKAAGAKGLVWTDQTLLDYLLNPAGYMPGNKMFFPGLKDEQDRRDLIAYLKTFSKP